MTRIAILALVSPALVCSALMLVIAPALATSMATSIPTLLDNYVETLVSPENKSAIQEAMREDPERDYESLAVVGLFAGQPDLAIWSLKRGHEQEPLDTATIGNLAVLLFEKGLEEELEKLVTVSLELMAAAITTLPSEWTHYHNLAAMHVRLYDRNGATPDLERAKILLKEALRLNPDAIEAQVKYGHVLHALGDPDHHKWLQKAFHAEPHNLSVMRSHDRLPGLGDILASDPDQCQVDYQCDTVCPLIGATLTPGIKHVDCNVAQANAITNCIAGRPYPTRWDCETEFPAFGIMIPGLDPGFSLITPWGSVGSVIDGDGIKFKFSGPTAKIDKIIGAGGQIGGEARYSNKTGDWSIKLSGSISASPKVPGQRTLDAVKAAGHSKAGTKLSMGLDTSGGGKTEVRVGGASATSKFRLIQH